MSDGIHIHLFKLESLFSGRHPDGGGHGEGGVSRGPLRDVRLVRGARGEEAALAEGPGHARAEEDRGDY